MSKIIGYARVSTSKQKLDLQITALKEAGCNKIYSDEGVSGKNFPRKGLTNALRALNENDTLIVYKLDRLGRSVLQLLKLMEKLEVKGAHFRSLSQTMDLTTASGKLIFTIFAAFAEFESNLNGERTKGGMQARKACGIHLGRKPKLSERQINSAREMLKLPGTSFSTVASFYKVSPNTIKRAVTRLRETA